MKKTITILVFFLLGLSAKAQWYAVPDFSFQNWLTNNGYSSSMNSAHDSINGSSSFVVNTSTIYVVGVACHNLNGIEAFVNLTSLTCGMCSLDSIHIFPASLQYLQLSYNNLRSLPTLPNTLQSLDCSNNAKLKNLPSLPNTISFLNCMVDSLTSLPNLPTSLTELYCGSNSISILPNLPSSLSFLDCSVNSISNIPSIPTNLKQLICGSNQLTQLPTLNFGLKDLECESNPITCFPKLPSTLDSLRYNNTLISCIPNYVSIRYYCSPLLSTLPLCNHTNTNTCPIICIKYDTINKTICGNQPYSFHNQPLTQSGTYHDTLQNYLGCDSIITLNLTVNNCMKVNAGADYTLCPSNTFYGTPGSFGFSGNVFTDAPTDEMFPKNITLTGAFDTSAIKYELFYYPSNSNAYVWTNSIPNYSNSFITKNYFYYNYGATFNIVQGYYYAPDTGTIFQVIVKVSDTVNNQVAYDTLMIHINFTAACDLKTHNDNYSTNKNTPILISPYDNDTHVANCSNMGNGFNGNSWHPYITTLPKHGTLSSVSSVNGIFSDCSYHGGRRFI